MRALQLAGVVTVWLSCGACGHAPTAPDGGQLVSLSIEAPIRVALGHTNQLLARGQYADGSRAPLTVTWAAAPGTVALVSPSGALLGLRLGRVTVSAIHESGLSAAVSIDVTGDPAVPIPASASLAGSWQGEYRLDVCERVSGGGPSVCRFILNSTQTIRLDLAQQSGELTGTLTLGDGVRGAVTGWQDAFSRHVLFGRLRSLDEDEDATFDLTRWDATAPDELRGTFEGVERFTASATGPQVYLKGGTFVGVRRR